MFRLAQRSLSAASTRVLAVMPARPVAPIAHAHKRCSLHSSASASSSAASNASASPADPAAAQPQEVRLSQMERPRPVTQFKRKPARDPTRFDLPPPARPTTEAEFEALKLKGYDGNVYDRMACYQLGQLFFDGVAAPKSTNTKPTAAALAAADAAAPSAAAPADEATEFVAGPWSLPKNYTQSLLWFTNAAFEGHVPSRTKLGVMYLAGYGIKRNLDTALQLFSESSEEGDRDAQAHLAAMHLQGVGTPKNLAKAVELYTMAAERGHVRAQSALAKLLDSPDSGALQDRYKATHWLTEAARASHTESQYLLAQKLEGGAKADPVAVFDWYTKAAQGGHAQSQYIVGLAHARNAVPSATSAAAAPSLDERMSAAARWFSMASEQGNVNAQARLGFLCFHGVGLARDEAAGLMWLSNAAEANQLDAQLMLGSIAFDEHERQQRDAPPAAGSKEEGKKLQTAKAYFDKVLENANKHDPSMPSRCLQQYEQQTGQPWIGDINVLLRHLLEHKA